MEFKVRSSAEEAAACWGYNGMEGGACLLYINYDLEEIRSKGAIVLGGSLSTSNSIVLLHLTTTSDQASA